MVLSRICSMLVFLSISWESILSFFWSYGIIVLIQDAYSLSVNVGFKERSKTDN